MGSNPTLPESGEVISTINNRLRCLHPRSKPHFNDGQRQAQLRWKKRTGFEQVHENLRSKCGQGFPLALRGAKKKIRLHLSWNVSLRTSAKSSIICSWIQQQTHGNGSTVLQPVPPTSVTTNTTATATITTATSNSTTATAITIKILLLLLLLQQLLYSYSYCYFYYQCYSYC